MVRDQLELEMRHCRDISGKLPSTLPSKSKKKDPVATWAKDDLSHWRPTWKRFDDIQVNWQLRDVTDRVQKSRPCLRSGGWLIPQRTIMWKWQQETSCTFHDQEIASQFVGNFKIAGWKHQKVLIAISPQTSYT